MKKLFLLQLTMIYYILGFAQYNYPATQTVDSVDILFGKTYKDPYRWLENTKQLNTVDWYKQQADYTNSILNRISGKDELITQFRSLDNISTSITTEKYFRGSRLFYKKIRAGENVGKLYYKEGLNGKEQLLFDPQNYIAGKTLSVDAAIPSYDGKKLAIAYTQGGSEIYEIKIIDIDTKTFLADSIGNVRSAATINWTFDNKAIMYVDRGNPANFNVVKRKSKLHKLGDDTVKDIDFFSAETYPELNIPDNVGPVASFRPGITNYVFAELQNVKPELFIYYASIEQAGGKIQWKPLCKPEDKLVRNIEIVGDDVYGITYNGANFNKLVYTSLKNPDWKNAKTLIEEKPGYLLRRVIKLKDYLVIVYAGGLKYILYKYHFASKKATEIKLPLPTLIIQPPLYAGSNTLYLRLTSWTQPSLEYKLDVATDKFSASEFDKTPVLPKELNALVVEEVEVKGHDGEMIPLSIIHKKGISLNGNATCFLTGYGAYGTSVRPVYNNFSMTLALKDVVVAVAHVRGGSEKGQDWYKAGYKTTKPNTWKDFISCAEYLIAKGYTSANKLAGEGTSAGGILISRAIAERPDLFAAAICNVGCANAMRLEFSANGQGNIPEFGTIKDSILCSALFEMDGMQHVVKNTNYPAVIGIGGWNDPRVPVCQPGKFIAALQNTNTSGKPTLLKINYDNGHFTEDKAVTYANFADQFAFILWQCGHPDFQLKK
jgi:prolyl oligopeptidase